jgi:peptide chain release factor 2
VPYGGIFDVASKRKRLETLEPQLSDPNFWNNPDKARKVSQEAAQLRKVLESFQRLEGDVQGLAELYEIASEAELADLDVEKEKLQKELDDLYHETLFNGDHDESAAILTIKPGAGGTESSDWAAMLLRMYRRFAEREGFNVEIMDVTPSDSAPNGVDYAQMIVRGERAYGMLRAEKGVHRLVRISPFDSNNRRHTSFAGIEIIPEIAGDVNIVIEPKDIRTDVYRSGGHGGQGVNTTDSAVRVVYKGGTPDEIVVTCQEGRSQIKNREKAMTVLKSRLWEREEQRRLNEQAKQRGEQKAIEWGSQMRSYVLDKQYIKDHRTGEMRHDPDNVLDGDIEDLIWSGLEWQAGKRATSASTSVDD